MKAAHKRPVDRNTALMLLALVSFNLIPHFNEVPLWISIAASFLLVWRLLAEFAWATLPGFWLRQCIYVVIFAFFFYQTRATIARESGIALLVLASSLKMLEMVGYRSFMMVLCICLLLLMSKLLSSQTMLMTAYLFVDVFAVTLIMLRMHGTAMLGLSWTALIKPTIRIFAFSSPLLAVLFIFFPRISGGFLPKPARSQAESGFSERLNPGEISDLALSEAVAFRVRFPQYNAPPMRDLYWRGGEFVKSYGMRWDNDGAMGLSHASIEAGSGSNIKQEIVLEPLFRNWIFSLDVPKRFFFHDMRIQDRLSKAEGESFRLTSDLPQRTLYRAESLFRPKYRALTQRETRLYTRISDTPSKAVLDLVEQWKAAATADRDIPDLAMQYLRQNDFRYSLNPGAMEKNTLDEFLFTKKVGFCEHYAAAFASLMRLAGLPARVVVGFQGGLYNDFDGYYTVTSKDAHAWTEVWSFTEQRWRRIDPTDAVAPGRTEFGGQSFLALGSDALGRQARDLEKLIGDGRASILLKAKLALEAVSTRWNLFLLSYDFEYQKQLLETLGFREVSPANLFGILLVIIPLLGLWYVYRQQQQKIRLSPAEKLYRKFCKMLAKRGLTKAASQPPIAFAHNCERLWPQRAKEVRQITQLYLDSHYGGSVEAVKQLHRAVDEFSKFSHEYKHAA